MNRAWLVRVAVVALSALMTAAAVAQPQWIAPRPAESAGAAAPSWLWVATPGQPAPTTQNAPAGTVWLARQFEGPTPDRHVRSARLLLAADNHATAYLNGTEVLRSDSWSAARSVDVAVRSGANVLAIEATNDAAGDRTANPGGVIACLTMTLDDGSIVRVVTDAQWRGSARRWEGFPGEVPPSKAEPAVVLGPVGAAPWHLSAAAFAVTRSCPMLRKAFRLDELPRTGTPALVRIVGLGHYELRCNGAVVGETVINQSWSEYSKTLYSQEFDLGPHLRQGENVLAVTLGNSFWRVDPPNDPGRYAKTDAMPDFSRGWPHLLWVDARILTPSGEVHFTSDQSWRWADSPLTFSHVYAGEDYDARAEQPGWDGPGFDDRAWLPAVIAPAPGGNITPLDGPGMKPFEVFDPAEIRHPAPGVFTYVFPQNCSALLRFRLTGGHAGDRIRFKSCEFMDDTGRVRFTYTWNTGKDIWHDYTKRGDEPEEHQTLFCYVGAQFVQVEGAVPPGDPNPAGLPVLERVQQVHVRADCPTVGSFSCSSPMHDGAERLIDWSIRSNMAHFPTDCPHREKNSWIEQDWHMARAMSYRYDVRAWLTKTCRDIRDTQLPDGHVPTNSPNYLVGVPPHGFWNEAPEWGIASVLVPWHLYEWYGDPQVLRDSYESARRYIDYLGTTAKDGTINSNLGDWYDFGHGKGNGPSQWTPTQVSATAIWACGADTLARMADALGRTDDAARYHALFDQIRRDFQRHFYDPATKTIKNNGSCQAGTAAALCIGLIPDADRAAALDAIVEDLRSRGWKQTPGEVLQVFLIRALAENGRGDVLHRIYDRDDIPSYGHMVASGLTTLPESWDARRGTGDSLNHFMLGHLMEWHYAYVAGIRQQPGSVGWKTILIAPQVPAPDETSPNAIRSAAASFISPAGRVASAWTTEGPEFTLTCQIPAGATGQALLPDGSRHELAAGQTVLRCRRP